MSQKDWASKELMVPPYDRPENQMWHGWVNNYDKQKKSRFSRINKTHKEEFLAGGGSEYLYGKYRRLIKQYAHLSDINIEAFRNRELISCYGPHLLFACRGFKPEIR